MQMGIIQIGVVLLNILLLSGGIAGFIFFIIVLFKINKALNIWLKKNDSN